MRLGSAIAHVCPREGSLCPHVARSRFCSRSPARSSPSHLRWAAAGGPAAQPPTDQIVVRLAPGASLDASALDATAGIELKQLRRLVDGSYVLKLPKRHGRDAVQAITDKLAARGDVVSAEPDALLQPLVGPERPALGASSGTCSPPRRGFYGANLPGAWDITTGSAEHHGRRDRHGLPAARRPRRPLRRRLRLHRRPARRERRQRARRRRVRSGRLDHERRERERLLRRAAGRQQLVARHARVGHDRRRRRTTASASPGSTRSRRSSRCGCSASAVATRATSPTRSAGRPDCRSAGVPANPTPDRVVNLSLGGSGACGSTTQNAINAAVAAGTVVVVAAGNSNANASNFTPANCANVITVAATGHTGKRAYYSNYGTSVEIAAPGGDAQLGKTILSTLNAGTTTPGRRLVRELPGHEHGDAARRRRRLADAVGEPVADAGAGDHDAAGRRATPFPAGSTCTTSIVRRRHRQRRRGGRGGERWRRRRRRPARSPRPRRPTSPRSPARRRRCSGARAPARRATPTASTRPTTTRAAALLVERRRATSATVSGLAPGTTYYWQVRATNAARRHARRTAAPGGRSRPRRPAARRARSRSPRRRTAQTNQKQARRR